MATGKFFLVLLLIGFTFGTASFISAHVPHDVVTSIQISPEFSQDKTIFAVVRNVVYRSEDGGYTWNRCSRGIVEAFMMTLAISPAFPADQTLFVVSTTGRVFRSQDGGRSWTLCRKDLLRHRVSLLQISPHYEKDSLLLASVNRQNLYQLARGGEEWKKVLTVESEILSMAWVDGLALMGTSKGELFGSEDDGASWQMWGLHPGGQKITAIEILPGAGRNDPFFVGTAGKGTFKVLDGGKRFQPATKGITDNRITRLASFQREGRTVLLATTWNKTFFRSDNLGENWRILERGLNKTIQADYAIYKAPHFSAMAVSDKQEIFIGGFSGLFRSSDGGRSWSELETLSGQLMVGINVSPMTGDGYDLCVTTYDAGGYMTRDQGASWEVNNFGLLHTRLGAIAYSPDYAKDGIVLSSTFDHVVRSTDGGAFWNNIPIKKLNTGGSKENGFMAPLVYGFSPDFDSDQTVFAGCYPQGVIKSVDKGATWTMNWGGDDSTVWSLVVSPNYPEDHTVYATLEKGLYRTVDSGESWERLESTSHLAMAFLAISPEYKTDRTLYAGGPQGFYLTRDGGATWENKLLADQEPYRAVGGLAISPFFETDRELLVQIIGGDLFRCIDPDTGFEAMAVKSENSDHEFSQERGFKRDRVPLIKFAPDYDKSKTLYGASETHAMKSTDRGKTWVKLARPLRYEGETYLSGSHNSFGTFTGKWNKDLNQKYSALKVIYSDLPQSLVKIEFFGTGITWIGTTGPDHGVASLSVDGEFKAHVDQYSDTKEFCKRLFTLDGLAMGPHTITLKVDDSRNNESTGNRIEIDAFDVYR